MAHLVECSPYCNLGKSEKDHITAGATRGDKMLWPEVLIRCALLPHRKRSIRAQGGAEGTHRESSSSNT